MGRMIFTSKGLNQKRGSQIIGKELAKDGDLSNKRIILCTLQEYYIDKMLTEACLGMGFKKENITIYDGEGNVGVSGLYDYVYVTEGNTFDIIHMLREKNMDTYIRNKVLTHGATYIGSSAGAMLAGTSFEFAEDFDKNRVKITDFEGLGLFGEKRVAIIPHYTKKEFQRYLRNSDQEVVARYDEIYYVSNYGVLVVEV